MFVKRFCYIFKYFLNSLKDLSTAEKSQSVAVQKKLDEKEKEVEKLKGKNEKLSQKLKEVRVLSLISF